MIENLRMIVGPSTGKAQRTVTKQGDGRSGKGAEGVGQAKDMAFVWSQYVKYFLRDVSVVMGSVTSFE